MRPRREASYAAYPTYDRRQELHDAENFGETRTRLLDCLAGPRSESRISRSRRRTSRTSSVVSWGRMSTGPTRSTTQAGFNVLRNPHL